METAFLRFGGEVDKDQYNFAGLGAVGMEFREKAFRTSGLEYEHRFSI